jgi:hypothetical protein
VTGGGLALLLLLLLIAHTPTWASLVGPVP